MAEVSIRKSVHNKIIGFLNQVKAHSVTPLDYHALMTIQKRATKTMEKGEAAQDILISACKTDGEIALQESAFAPLEATYQELENKLARILVTVPAPGPSAGGTPGGPASTAVSVKLPAIELPTFDGNFANWMSFKDLFIATVDSNTQLSRAQILQYLKSALQGEPSNLIRAMTITDANYSESMSLLNERYDNKREIVYSIITKIINYKRLNGENALELQALQDCVSESIRALKALACPTDKWDDILIVILLNKLDPTTRREWAIRQTGTDLPTMDQFIKFLSSHIRGLLATCVPSSANVRKDRQVRVHHATPQPSHCVICTGNHPHYQCQQLITKSVSERHSTVKANRLCFNCLSKDHQAKKCSSKRSCHKCSKRHHTLLHDDSTKPTQEPAINFATTEHTQPPPTVHANQASVNSCVALKTAVVQVPDRFGNLLPCRVFIDDGSQGEFISEACVSRLQLRRQFSAVTIKGFGDTKIGISRGMVEATLVSRLDCTKNLKIIAHVLPKLTSIMPGEKHNADKWAHLKGLPLADPQWFVPGHVDITVGAKYFSKIIGLGRREGPINSPTAYESLFGWIISGEVSPASPQRKFSSCQVKINPDIDYLRHFWEIEEPPKSIAITGEEEFCEDHFLKNYNRDHSGRFHVAVPFNGRQRELGYSRDASVRRLLQVERRLRRHPQYQEQYVSFMREYINMGHMSLVPTEKLKEEPGKTFYLPHHFVVNESSSTTKLRVVFDGSAKSTTGVSINDCMMVGGKTQDDLYDQLLRFRFYPIVLKADITKMFRQFRLHQPHTDYHRIVWRETPQEPIQDFNLLTVTYGTACATFLATRCVNQLGMDIQETFPVGSDALTNSMFVDDLMLRKHSVQEAILAYKELTKAVQEAGLELRKWSSNHPDVLAVIPENMQEINLQSFGDTPVKALGIYWCPSSDVFMYTTYDFKEGLLTKRILLSELSRVFDPLGLISCVTVTAKLLMQALWKLCLDWDDSVPREIEQGWCKYKKDISKLADVRIPRLVTAKDFHTLEIHSFGDSSERAFGANVYLRIINPNGVKVTMVTSKSRVAPLKPLSIPRLELCAALEACKLAVHVKECLNLSCKIFLWTDSTIVLTWISSSPRRWKTFVCHRVAQIQELCPTAQWSHVQGKENPADLVSRGVSVEELLSNSLWFAGPVWLSEEPLPIIAQPCPDNDLVDVEKRKESIKISHAEIIEVALLQRFSSLNKLKRVTCYIIRFWRMLKKLSTIKGPLQPDELNNALMLWIKTSQQQHFNDAFSALNKSGKLNCTSKLRRLYPFIDSEGVLRVGGRINNSTASYNMKHPVILPGKSHLVYLLVHHFHHSLYHAGFQHVWASLQREYWIINGRDRVRHIIRSCVTCRRYNGIASEQLMGALPSSRVTPGRPFLSTGVDYCGPFMLKNPIGRPAKTYKGYLCVFVCMSTKAVHLEPVSALTTEAFLDCLSRFVSRRGYCTDIYSDCGSNFIGADHELKKLIQNNATQELVTAKLSNASINWHFNPPSSPHHGGLWEAAVKSAKFHLKRVLGNNVVSYEDFHTVLCRIEAILNSRPLTPFSSEVGDCTALTPGHFLVGEPLTAIPSPNLEDIPANRLTKFQVLQQHVQHFWRRWSREYLHTLQQRSKWMWEKSNVKSGDLVLLKEDTSPGTWKMARVVEVHPGQDGKVRVATIKTSSSTFQRPVVKLIPLLTDHSN